MDPHSLHIVVIKLTMTVMMTYLHQPNLGPYKSLKVLPHSVMVELLEFTSWISTFRTLVHPLKFLMQCVMLTSFVFKYALLQSTLSFPSQTNPLPDGMACAICGEKGSFKDCKTLLNVDFLRKHFIAYCLQWKFTY